MSSTVRETALDHISTAQPVAPLPAPEQGKALANGYGCDVFNTRVMRQRLPREVYDRLMRTMTHRTPLDPADADIIAGAMKDWALEHGATHYTHWFQPMTGFTAEKHDSFISPIGGGQVVMDFSGKELCDGCGVLDPLLVPGKLLLSGEYARLVKEITKLSGFAEQEDEVKN